MAKIITDKELLKAIQQLMAETDDGAAYGHLLEDLAEVVADHTGCEVGQATPPDDIMDDWTVSIYAGDDPLVDFWFNYDPDGVLDDKPY